MLGAQRRQVLPGQRHDRRAVLVLERQLPALRRLDRVGRAEHLQVRDRAQGGQVLDRLVRRAVLAEADRIVGAHVITRCSISAARRIAGAAVVGEDQEGAAVGDDAAVQRHAVHRRRHAVLADAVVDVAAGVVAAAACPRRALRVGVVRAGEVGRAADHLGHRLRRAPRAPPGSTCASPIFGLLGRELRLQRLGVASASAGRSPGEARSNSARFVPADALEALRPSAAAASAAAPPTCARPRGSAPGPRTAA